MVVGLVSRTVSPALITMFSELAGTQLQSQVPGVEKFPFPTLVRVCPDSTSTEINSKTEIPKPRSVAKFKDFFLQD